MALTAVELFAGAGGTSEGASRAGLNCHGIDNAPRAVAINLAAGHDTMLADLHTYGPHDYLAEHDAPDMLLASPPCTTFSQAGKGSGRKYLDLVLQGAQNVARGDEPFAGIDTTADDWDIRTELTLVPLHWARVIRPTYIALEQVPHVLPVWERYAEILTAWGYSVWTGMISAETHGVAQTRKRAWLIARNDGQVAMPPVCTHANYKKGESAAEAAERTGLLPWVSMAEALGWGMTKRPSVTVPAAGTSGGGPRPLDGGSGARQIIRDAQDGDDTWMNTGRDWKPGGDRDSAQQRHSSEPAPTVSGARSQAKWEGVPDAKIRNQSGTEIDRTWPAARPSTTVAGRALVQHPGEVTNRFNSSSKTRNDGVRVEAWEAGVLQGFDANYPWHAGETKTDQFMAVGNAVPPPVAEAVIRSLTSDTASTDDYEIITITLPSGKTYQQYALRTGDTE